ncbi:UvrD-helicase domain-containing protein [Gillisia sp. M10.2A]|uniref:DNA 3'-5' helicase n=1 Tax=Gillisia lutea TaxID=2909668 RepID=A0ABS9EFK3_9FLAO|nr:UvrD-helicase domain-containing protein [Gillisia lutea]MCF4100560.1 UvrD-helicase domain-containing protein [Gillisia lutea]
MRNQNTFTVYNASAGSGKTFTLVKEYLLLLLKSTKKDAYRNILAITFTNKAVAEMKSRVIAALNALATTPCPQNSFALMDTLKAETGFSEMEIQQKSKDILKSILHNYAAFDISTIDRFTHKIIRTFAKDLGIPVNFEVELNTEFVLQEAVDRVINRAGEDKKLTKVLLAYTLSKIDDDKSWDITADLFSFSRLLIQENHQQYIKLLSGKTLNNFEEFSQSVKTEIRATEAILDEISTQFFSLCKTEGLEKAHFSRGFVYSYFKKLSDKNYKVSWGAQWQENIDTAALYSKTVPASKQDSLDQNQDYISSLFKTSRSAIFKREFLKEVANNITPLSLLSEISAEIQHIKTERALVLISDFNPTIAKEINNQPAPFIYERLGERYKNYFIDEFQDTSEMQWQNMIPLVDHALSTEQVNNETSSLTLVGDAKQSIYRFRGGKAEQFIDLYGSGNPFNVEKNIVNLPSNHRSARNIVEFNNSFFKYVAGKFDNPTYKTLFENSSQEVIKDFDGYVNISFLETQNKEEEMQVHPEKVLEIIHSKGLKRGDICVLTRTKKESFAVANYLSEQGVAIVSSESLLISNSPEVNFVNAIFQFSLSPEDKNIRWELLNYLIERLEIADPHKILLSNLHLPYNEFFDWLNEIEINFDLEKLQVLSLYEAAEYIINSFYLIETSNAYLQFYLDFIFEHTNNNYGGIPEFLEIWDQKKSKLSILAPKTQDAVQIMTIHKSKGLEFPVVIYPFANSKIKDVSREKVWVPMPDGLGNIPVGYLKASQNMLNWGEAASNIYLDLLAQNEFDSMNVLYVAFTRASQQLYILSNLDTDSKGNFYEDKVSGLLTGYLKWKNLWEESKTFYEIGENLHLGLQAETSNSIKPSKNISSFTQNSAVKIVTKAGSLWGSEQEKAIENGILVHDLLAEIDTPEDMPKALEKYSKLKKLSDSKTKELKELILQVLTHPELNDYFTTNYSIYREKDIISPTGEILRPDRLNFQQKKVVILDYKTGSSSNSHITQMNGYAQILSEMGFEISKKILIYINNKVNIQFV